MLLVYRVTYLYLVCGARLVVQNCLARSVVQSGWSTSVFLFEAEIERLSWWLTRLHILVDLFEYFQKSSLVRFNLKK